MEFYNTKSGISAGSVNNNETLLRAGKKLIERGDQVIAVVCKFDDPPEDNYKDGEGVDIVGGIEAVISHYLTRELQVPVVHAPAFENIEITGEIVDKRAAAEYITPTFLPCLLVALKNAPLYNYEKGEQYLSMSDLEALIMPYNALGSSIVADSLKFGKQIYAVKENHSVLNITKNIITKNDIIIETDSYEDCFKILKEKFYDR